MARSIQARRDAQRRYREANPEKERRRNIKYREDNLEKVQFGWAKSRLRKRGHTMETREAVLKSQDYKCAVCKSDTPGYDKQWCIDHDHARPCNLEHKLYESHPRCNRGLLCHGCNVGNGITDNPALLRCKAEYLDLWNERLDNLWLQLDNAPDTARNTI